MHFRLYIDSNHRQMDTTARTMHGEYATYGLAVAEAKSIVDDVLESLRRPGMTGAELMEAFVTRGEAPFIMPDDDSPAFDARVYAQTRCLELDRS